MTLARLDPLRAQGESDHAFGWSWRKEARASKAARCVLAEAV